MSTIHTEISKMANRSMVTSIPILILFKDDHKRTRKKLYIQKYTFKNTEI